MARATLELPGEREAGGNARAALAHLLGSHLDDDELVRLKIVVSELVNNALLHGRVGPADTMVVHVRVRADCVRGEVQDRGAGFAWAGSRDPSRAGGFGLLLVDAESDRWGVGCGDPADVWFEFDREPGAAGTG